MLGEGKMSAWGSDGSGGRGEEGGSSPWGNRAAVRWEGTPVPSDEWRGSGGDRETAEKQGL